MANPRVSIIIPTYNEAENISKLISTIGSVLQNYTYEIIVVDDHSTDATVAAVRKIADTNSSVKLFMHTGARDLGRSILQGIAHATGDVIVGIDADFNHDPAVLPHLIKKTKTHDLVVASRFMKGGGMEDTYRYYTSLASNMIFKTLFRYPILDNTSGYYAIHSQRLRLLPLKDIYRGYGEYHLRLVYCAHHAGLSLATVPVFYKNRVYGASQSRFMRMFVQYCFTSFQLWMRYGLISKFRSSETSIKLPSTP